MFCVTSSDDQLQRDLNKFFFNAWRGERSAFASLEYIKHCILALNEKNEVTSLDMISGRLRSRILGI